MEHHITESVEYTALFGFNRGAWVSSVGMVEKEGKKQENKTLNINV